MPITRIAIPERRFNAWQSKISEALQQSLESCFSVPANDCFQLFDRYGETDRVFDKHYLSGDESGRSEDLLVFQITAGRPRNIEQKQALYAALVERLHKSIGINPQDVMIVVTYTEPEDWSFGGGKVFHVADIPK
jgi:phenylpyruvate tautomerase PptA (4-oxalocrotonate tautomerase family)